MEKIRARLQGKKNVYIHNDLSNAAFHFKKLIEEKLKRDDRAGITFDYMACLVMLAFTFEAKMNFLGAKLVSEWEERQSFDKKLSQVFSVLKLAPDFGARPYNSIKRLKDFRDSVAHGKPVEVVYDETVETTQEEIDKIDGLDGEWLEYCSHDSVFEAYDDVDTIWRDMLSRSKLEVYETLTRGEHSATFIERIKEVN